MKLSNNFEEVLRTFNQFDVNYMVAGGYAVIFYGYPRTTNDIAIWVQPSKNNKSKIIAAFKRLNYPIAFLSHLEQSDFTEPFAVKIGKEPIQLDMFNAITGVDYENAKKNWTVYKAADNLEVRLN